MIDCPGFHNIRRVALPACLMALALAAAIASAAAAKTPPPPAAELPLVPWPKSIHLAGGSMVFNPGSRIVTADAQLLPLAKILAEEIHLAHGADLPVARGDARSGDVVLSLNKRRTKGYTLEVGDKAVVSGADYIATAQGTVTLLQAMRNSFDKITLPWMTIEDEPYFAYCGAMLDIARKPHSIATLKRCVLAARMYKIRFIQLHMSDENAWTFPSTAYPQLGKTNFAWAGGDKPAVYNLDELKQLVAFADARGVTFVPELETPGHSAALRGSLPEVFGYKDNAGKMVGKSVINIVSDRAYKALDTIVGEMCDVFKSSPYFHVGCDESSLDIQDTPEFKEWVQRHHLPEPHLAAVFCYHLQKMDEIVKKRGKRMVVWEGPPLDPIAPPKDVIFMPWVGGAGSAAEYVRRGYAIINPPWGVKSPYFDPFDVNGAEIPRGNKLLIGATSISWEATEDKALGFFRYAAVLRNEPTWNPDSARAPTGRDLDDFLIRHQRADKLLDALLVRPDVPCRGPVGSPRVRPAGGDVWRQAEPVAGNSSPTVAGPLYAGRQRADRRVFAVHGADPIDRYGHAQGAVLFGRRQAAGRHLCARVPQGDDAAARCRRREDQCRSAHLWQLLWPRRAPRRWHFGPGR